MAVDVTNSRSIDTLVNLVQREGVRAHVFVPGGAPQKPRGDVVVVHPVVLYQIDATFDRELLVAARGLLPSAASHERGDRHHQYSGRQQHRSQGGAGQHDGLSGHGLRGRGTFCGVNSHASPRFSCPLSHRVLFCPTMSRGTGGSRSFYSPRRSGITKL
ncbi:m134 protein [Murid betaherpesvirus 1]|uniref:M134 protein n=1 Tax=Murid herpesvirus 1 TaxID=10366 RepID=H2A121_MUHV1|nr:m134 protein [Murid betaherpesvirus 1]CCE56964.1 m134 protein [Murid betaherpesvirus 1]CCE57460.1 m134 protein [Murid betaherpesvirus 1]